MKRFVLICGFAAAMAATGSGCSLEIGPAEDVGGGGDELSADAGLLDEIESGSVSSTACGCDEFFPSPTRDNGGCADSSYNCWVSPRRTCDGARLLNRATCGQSFPLKSGAWTLFDSTGAAMGTVTASSIQIQTGVRAVGSNLGMVLAFATATDHGTFSGWLTTEALAGPTYGNYDTQPQNPGGEVSQWHSVPSNNAPYLDSTGHSLKVRETCGTGRNATDYLGRNGTFNMTYNAPGTDYGSVTVGVRKNTVAYNFYRYTRVHTIERPLWSCATGSPRLTSTRLKFLYGRMYERHIDRAGKSVVISRRGWVALPNLAPGAGTQNY
jgi:hypothetical protein